MGSLEYKALQEYYMQFEKYISLHLESIAAALAKSSIRILKAEQRDEILRYHDSRKGAKKLLEIVTLGVQQAQDFFIFDTLLEVADVNGNLGMQNLVTNIKSYCHEEYRGLFPEPSNSPGDECDVFISYGRECETNKFVDLLESRLHLKVFIDRTGISPGAKWPKKIANALHSCKAFVAVLTKKYVNSLYCRGELFQAVHVNKKIFTAVRESGWNQEPSWKSVQAEVKSIQYASVQDGAKYETNLSELIESISNYCQPNHQPPVEPVVNTPPPKDIPVVNSRPGPANDVESDPQSQRPTKRVSKGSMDSAEQGINDETSPQPKHHCPDDAESSQSDVSPLPKKRKMSHDSVACKGGASLLQVNTHLQPVRKAVLDVQSEWRDLGRALKIPNRVIKSIADVDNQPSECFYNVLEKWMQTGKATIHDLLKALEDLTVGRKDIADDIRARKGKDRTEVGL